MHLKSDSFAHNASIPSEFAFGIFDAENHMRFGPNKNPHLSWSDAPAGTASLVLMCIDPDVPTRADDVNQEGKVIPADLARTDFTHWAMVDIPTTIDSIAAGACSEAVTPGGKSAPNGPAGSRQGLNDYTDFLAGDPDLKGNYLGYDGPCPPWNDERLHHYCFRLFATDLERCPVGDNFTANDVIVAIQGHILDQAELIGLYSLNPAIDY
jgi:Raf kinase inhibitor-like YbhB/YbcL family protein